MSRQSSENQDKESCVAGSPSLIDSLNEAQLSRFHIRAVLVSGMGFFADAYDLFIIGIASTLIRQQWHLASGQLGLLNGMTLAASFLGAFAFGRVADVLGRKRVYWMVAAIMVVGAVASALAPNFALLVAARFVLGVGVGGDYPVSAVLMSEWANRKDRGRLVSMVFSAQALGLIIGPLIALSLLGAGTDHHLAWRLMLGLGAVPAAAVLYLRGRMPESPRYQLRVQVPNKRKIRLTNRRNLLLLAGTAGTWFIFDYAYYGNTISTPQILKLVAPHASLTTTIALQLAIFAIAAVPGYALAMVKLDKIGHRKLQRNGFVMMAVAFAVIGVVPGVATAVVPFMLAYGVSYFFAEFGPNTTTFVLPSELFPVEMRATSHGISAGLAKFGAFLGVFFFPMLQSGLGLRGTLTLTAGFSLLGAVLTLVLPEPAGRSLEEISGEDEVVAVALQHLVVADPPLADLPGI
jgi:PHS family inorganic phosphate transporter-like MFS transporter